MTLDLEAIEARCEAARHEVNRLCLSRRKWTIRGDDTDIVLANALRDIPALVAEVRRLQRELHDEHCLMIMYSDRGAAVRRKLQEVGAMVSHEEITNLDAIARLAAQIGQLRRELHDERVRRDEWEKMYGRAVAGTEVGRLHTELEQAQSETASDIGYPELANEMEADAAKWKAVAEERWMSAYLLKRECNELRAKAEMKEA